MPAGDGRVFITNRNDNSLSILDLSIPCPADIDGNGVVDVTDLLIMLYSLGPCP